MAERRCGPPALALLEMPPEEARRGLTKHLLLALEVTQRAADKVRHNESALPRTADMKAGVAGGLRRANNGSELRDF